jgi:hypothetical protein
MSGTSSHQCRRLRVCLVKVYIREVQDGSMHKAAVRHVRKVFPGLYEAGETAFGVVVARLLVVTARAAWTLKLFSVYLHAVRFGSPRSKEKIRVVPRPWRLANKTHVVQTGSTATWLWGRDPLISWRHLHQAICRMLGSLKSARARINSSCQWQGVANCEMPDIMALRS